MTQNKWHKTQDELPHHRQLVFALPQRRLLRWNHVEEFWDNQNMDEYCYEKNVVQYWYPIPPCDLK